jgi:hypothetical protein
MDPEGEFFFARPYIDFDFAISDARGPNLYSYRILVFKIDSLSAHVATTNALKKGLQKLVERCPPLGGIVAPVENKPGEQGGWKKVVPGPGIKLIVRDLRSKLSYQDIEVRDFPTEAFKCDDVVPYSLVQIMEDEAAGSVFQYTWIKGGALLTLESIIQLRMVML